MPNAVASGQLVYLRPVERQDAKAICTYFNDPEVANPTLQYRPLPLHVEEAMLEKITSSPTDILFAITLKDGDRMVGVCGLHGIDARHRRATFGIVVGAKELWGKGIGSEATRLVTGYGFDTLNLHRIELQCVSDNLRGIRAYEKAGFRKEGLLRQQHSAAGRWHDSVTMGALRSDWEELVGKRG